MQDKVLKSVQFNQSPKISGLTGDSNLPDFIEVEVPNERPVTAGNHTEQ